MRKLYFQNVSFWVCGLLMLGIASCKKGGFLGATSTTDLTQATVFKDSARTAGFLANIYSNINYSASPTRFVYDPLGKGVICGGLEAATDEAEPSHAFSTTASAFATGTVNAGIVDDGPYRTCYNNIRSVNQFLKNLPITPIKASNKALMIAEARFLRAWYYAILLKHYGGVPMVGDSIMTYETPINVKRSTYADCVNYITSELDAAGAVLPVTQTGADYGRASRGACLALKARVLLYAASPLFNGTTLIADAGGKTDPALVGYPTADANRWKLAKDAAASVISLNAYTLNTVPPANVDASTPGAGFQGLFPQRVNSEYIFEFMRPGNSDLENLFLPPSRAGANGAFPYQGLVDAFPMKNGKLITDPTSGYDPNNPYANRDPRLDYSIIHDQTVLLVRLGNGTVDGRAPVNIFLGSYNGNVTGQDAVRQGTPTGYYRNKMLDPNAIAATLQSNSQRVLPLIRYAEVLLNYAEAANEFDGPTNEVYTSMNMIRQRAGLSPSALPAGLSKEEMRKYIQNERRIELAFEEHRFWDVRRWKIAGDTENIQSQGMEVKRTNTTATFTKFNVTKHNFRAAMYLWPFPLSETGKSPTLVQNPGY
ncbi:RagB/SusD family nutrient uptake outer membrane protein [Mucilaginibacter celer]|uniref:RagB/SusD family nutrient uptake outer membrane protein n=1 Tax=Mucilaginibacter celer TaxID=2305508 RepID=A0A494VJJ1_9SPHI|nr:RagB/SusD family nutrient uptake outer membrane protein [Mucilaginibacter celer]AYL94414.1 RagB/SusD family nutrient uptake outer membrane protein [Mucilaginibacter celer]